MRYSFKQNNFNENELEQAIIELFKQQGYIHISGEKISRQYENIILEDDLRSFISLHYINDNLSDIEMNKIINKLNHISATPLYSGNKETFYLINEGFNLIRDDTKQLALHIDYIDYKHPENNIFKVVNQYSVQGERLRRPDLLIFINGIPIAICEFKTTINEDTTIYDAWKQITIRYCRDIPQLMKYCFLSIISDGVNTKMGTIFTPYSYYYSWNKANDKDNVSNGISSLFTMIEGAFSKERLLNLLHDFIFYPDNSKKDTAIVCRYPQFFGALKMMNNIKHHMRPNGDGKGGTYFGATGCGKTYTMLFLSRLICLRDSKTFNNPTIIILTDRDDLNTQTTELFITAKKFLHEEDVRSIKNRKDLFFTLKNRPSGGIYITTIQKFCENTGLLSTRSNIICISDEAHRTQTGVNPKLKKTDKGVFTTYGFGYYLRSSFPNATYCGFTGTPIDETLTVFGDVVDRYTMKESCDDGITVRIAYEPRLARVMLSEKQAKEIQKYYENCAQLGATEEQIEKSKRAMSKVTAILGHPDRIKKLAADIVKHYETYTAEKPQIVQKAMIVCANRNLAFETLKAIIKLRPEWNIPKKAENETKLTKQELDELIPLPKINLVATRNPNDEIELYNLCGTKEYRNKLDEQFKNNNSNFQIAVVVDMWITGFDVPSLAVMYIDKPLQKHTLIQTISRVNRVFEGKDKGLVIDYIGIQKEMMEAIKQYGNPQDSPVDKLDITLNIFRNHLALLNELMSNFNMTRFFVGNPIEKLNCLNEAAEYVQSKKDTQTRFMGLSKRLKSAYIICAPSQELTKSENDTAQFYLAIRSIIYKQTKENTPDAEIMNNVVEEMVRNAITCTGIENIVSKQKSIDVFSDDFLQQLDKIKMPITKFNALLKLLKKAIFSYSHTNKVKAIEFDQRLKQVVEEYNNRDKLVFTNKVITDFVNNLSKQLIKIINDLKEDQHSYKTLDISYEEKAFYDILIKVRDDNNFSYPEEKCLTLAKKIKQLVTDKSQYADWSTREDIKSQLNMDLTILLYDNGYPPDWSETVFEKVMEQAENFKKYNPTKQENSFSQLKFINYSYPQENHSLVADKKAKYTK